MVLRQKGQEYTDRVLAVAFSHDKIEGAKNGGNVRDHVVDKKVRKDGEVDKGRGADLQSVRNASTLGVDIESEFALGVFRTKIDLSCGGFDALGGNDEMMD